MHIPRTRSLVGGVLALSVAALAACNQSTSPLAPSFAKKSAGVTTLSSTSATWDFAQLLIDGTAGPVDEGASVTVTNGSFGQIVASSPDAHVTVKGGDLVLTASERGLGLCHPSATNCSFPDDGDEVGDGGPGTLLLNFDGVLPAGSQLEGFSLGSLQDHVASPTLGEGYRYSISTDGGQTFGSEVQVLPDESDTIADVTLPSPVPTADLVVKFQKSTVGSDDNDYTVRSVTISQPGPELLGRMTGGGVKATGSDNEVVTFGLTLHCDILLSNNLEVNWQGHQWHLTKPIETATCTNQQNDAPPPASPIDTFEGTAYGKLDGVANSYATFKFEDHGEPGTSDRVQITIYQPGSTSTVALEVPDQLISVGNWQMHYDQPHGQHP